VPRRALTASLLAVMMALAGVFEVEAATGGPSSPVCVPRTTAPAAGLSLVSSQPVNGHPRVSDLTFSSKALGGPVHVDVLVPAGYDPTATARYPVLYLLHGHGGHYNDWVNHGVDAVIGDLPAIVVMPDGGYDGFYADWYGSDVDGHTPTPPPAWETFHLRELLPWVDQQYRTVPARTGRAVAGLSMGGFGTMSYAARHPDLFVAAASFSGAVDTHIVYPAGGLGQAVASNLPDQKPVDLCIWGDPLTQDVVWRDHDPTELARNLGGSLFQATGNGQPGRYDDPSKPSPSPMFTEFGIGQMNQDFDQALTAAGVAHTTYFYGNGTHSWPYWLDDLRTFLPQLRAAFASPPPAPPTVPFSFESAGAPFSVWDWTFTPHRDVNEMTYLSGVSATGLIAAGSGKLHVDTAPLYKKRMRYEVTGTGGKGPTYVVADSAGRLHFDVDLGPSHATQQYVFGPQAESSFAHARVAIRMAMHRRKK
jgi:S-formylglutathione hydrolase FrmB